ncbi:MAG: hypothetical protein J6331_06240 [Lentisphaeria bacterium]|nr:hypothetical protein [Lentisphaeria bacterium]
MKKRDFCLNIITATALTFACLALTAAESPAPSGEGKVAEKVQGTPLPPPPLHHPRRMMGGREKGRMDRFPGGPARRGGAGPFSRFTPEEHAELRRLATAGDREGFGKKMRELRMKYATEEDRKVFLLEEKYHAAKTPEEKALLKKELRDAVLAQIRVRNEFTLKQIAAAEEKLKKLKEFHAKNVENADKIAGRITEFICTPPAERKKFRRPPAAGGGRENPPAPAPASPEGATSPQGK